MPKKDIPLEEQIEQILGTFSGEWVKALVNDSKKDALRAGDKAKTELLKIVNQEVNTRIKELGKE